MGIVAISIPAIGMLVADVFLYNIFLAIFAFSLLKIVILEQKLA